ncbi:MAG: PGF-CTERM sorting domain-containing protein [archaeon]|nr:PGF-CTERM sorting domain-containing protein [archaeon]MDA1130887.1 PGF-CTERM sorting domain-containing protein [archaeon]
MALALITTTFAGISSADHDEEHGFDWDWDNETGILTIIPAPLLNTTTFNYDVSIMDYDWNEQFYVEGFDIPTANVSLTTNLSDGYYMLSISVWNDDGSGWNEDGTICMGLNCSETQVDIIYDETTMVATLLVTGINVSNETITASLFDEWTGNEQVLYNVSNGDTIDIGGQGDGYFCLFLIAETADGFEIDSDEICIQIGEEPVEPSIYIFYNNTTMMMTVDLYDMPDNSTLHYSATIGTDFTSFETWDNGTIDSNTTSIGFDIDEILSSNNQSYGNYWASVLIESSTTNYLAYDGTFFCYGDYMQCEEEVEEMFICDDGQEIPMDFYDDGYADCEDGSDEPNGTGSEDTFICDNGEEIPMSWYDDGEADCEDGSDEPNGTDNEEEEIEFVSHDMDIWFEQWDDESMEFVMVNRMVIDDSEAIALYAMMADMFLGNNDGEVSQDEVDSFIEMMNEETDDEGVNEAMMQLDGAPGTMVDTWMEIEGLVGIDESNVNESEIVMIMVEVVAFDTTAYADSTTHIFTIDDDDDGDSSEEPVPDEGCDIDSIWIHNSDTWSVSSVSDSANNMSFAYEEFNNAWFTEDCPDDSGTVTFNLVKTDGGELPDATEDNDWEDLDTNRFPICAYAYAMMLPDGEFDVRVGIGAAPESGDYIIDLVDGAKYMISVVCSDPEGDDMTVTIANADLNLTSTYTSTATAEASLILSVPAGYDGTYVFDVTWTDGYHVESGNLTIIGLGDGSNDDDISADGDGFLPGFTAALGIVALLGAAMIGSRRNRA